MKSTINSIIIFLLGLNILLSTQSADNKIFNPSRKIIIELIVDFMYEFSLNKYSVTYYR
jgi:hypothetical protein